MGDSVTRLLLPYASAIFSACLLRTLKSRGKSMEEGTREALWVRPAWVEASLPSPFHWPEMHLTAMSNNKAAWEMWPSACSGGWGSGFCVWWDSLCLRLIIEIVDYRVYPKEIIRFAHMDICAWRCSLLCYYKSKYLESIKIFSNKALKNLWSFHTKEVYAATKSCAVEQCVLAPQSS